MSAASLPVLLSELCRSRNTFSFWHFVFFQNVSTLFLLLFCCLRFALSGAKTKELPSSEESLLRADTCSSFINEGSGVCLRRSVDSQRFCVLLLCWLSPPPVKPPSTDHQETVKLSCQKTLLGNVRNRRQLKAVRQREGKLCSPEG